MLVVVTSGGVKEKIDNVRSITNSSSGKLGMKIARNFIENCPECKVIYIYGGTAAPCDGAENIYIRDTQNLLDVVSHTLISNKVDIFIHSMAVADYTTSAVIDINKLKEAVCTSKNAISETDFNALLAECSIENNGKISSYMDAPAIMLKKTPKVIEQIKKLSPYTFLVGFKLLDNVSEDELFDVGFNLLRKNRCNLVLANDIHNIRQGNHRGMLIYPEKTYDIIEGKDEIAKFIVSKSIERFNVKHPKSIQDSTENNIPDSIYSQFFTAGQKLDNGIFLPHVTNHERSDKEGTYGNLSCRNSEGFYITCRNVNKGALKKTDISRIDRVDIIDDKNVYSNVHYNSELKPSIDASIHSQIYRFSSYSHIIHIHTDRVFLGYPLIPEAYPCGCDLECNAIVEVVKEHPNTHVIQMKKHGLIILGNSFDECYSQITHLFENVPYIDYSNHEVAPECAEHIKEVNPEFYSLDNLYSLKINTKNIGCIFERINEKNVHFGIYTMSNIRGKGLHIVEKYLNLYENPYSYILHTTTKCNIAEFYKNKYGFINYDISNENDLKYVLYK